jgi:hypothetical protein
MTKKSASLDSLVNAATAQQEEPQQPEKSPKAIPQTPEKRGKGRPKKVAGNRQQLPVYLPESLYFEMLDYVNLKKRSDRQFSLNDLVLESMDLWLKSLGKPSIQELIDSENS